jgi:hypothetical protein
LTAIPGPRVTVGELLGHLEGRAVALLLLILALPMCIPNVPGISTVFGFLMIAPALQLLLGRGRIWLPRGLLNASFDRESLRKAVCAAVPALRRVETLLKPRLAWATAAPFTAFFGAQALLLAIVLILPIAGGNWPPGISMAILALGLLQRDGVAAILSTVASVVSLAGLGAFYYYAAKTMLGVGGWIGG